MAKKTQPPTKRAAAAPVATGAEEFRIAHVREDGVHLNGEDGLPLNHRLRAEALVAAGKHEDLSGLIGKELIADTRKRLAAEAAAEAAAATPAAVAPPPPPPPADDEEKIEETNQ